MENQSLPEEVCRDIISRLPVKSLLRFRCVSKSWLSMISDPDFCLLHLKNFKNNRDETHLLAVQRGPQHHCVVRCSDTFKTITETLIPPLRHGKGNWCINCPVNGLYLLVKSYRRDNLGWASDKLLWNPSIRKFHDIPSSPHSSFKEADIGLGYDPSGKDYKYVKLVRENPNLQPLVEIYTLGVGSWKIIPFQGKGFSHFEWDFDRISRLTTVYLHGILYFLAINVEMDVWGLASFDLRSELFDFISLPDKIADIRIYYWTPVTLVRYGCSSLALLDKNSKSIWVFEIESMCWTNPTAPPLVVGRFLYLTKNRDILLWGCKQTSFGLATDNKFLVLQKENCCVFCIINIYGYIESLVLLK